MNKQFKIVDGEKVNTKIEWTDWTWNPISGCLHGCRWHMPDGTTAICYAETIANKFNHAYRDGFDHHYWKPELLSEPSKVKEPSKIFVGSMADVFGHWVPQQQIEDVLLAINSAPQHQFQMLTKNAVRSKQFELPPNVWLGSSSPPDVMWGKDLSQDQKERMLVRSLDSLETSNAAIKWMSFEPLSWDVTPIVWDYANVLDWAVIGAASNGAKEYAPNEQHVMDLVGLLEMRGTPVFYKGNLKTVPFARDNWREEFPTYETETLRPVQMGLF